MAKQQAGKPISALENIGESSRKIIDSLSDIVWTINPENDDFEKVIERMKSFAYQIMKAKKIESVFRSDPALNKLKLPMEVRKNFYLIFKEATNNLVKYSNCKRASFHITFENKNITLTIRDNGKGFNINEQSQGNGIKNMNRRAVEINAKLTIESGSEKGTTIELILKT